MIILVNIYYNLITRQAFISQPYEGGRLERLWGLQIRVVWVQKQIACPRRGRALWHEPPHEGHLAPQHSSVAQPSAPVLGLLRSTPPLSPQCPPNLHKLDGYYCDHEQV